MTAEEYLSQAKYIDLLIDSHINEVEQLRRLSDSLPSLDLSKERIKGGPEVQSRMTEIVNKYIDLQAKINLEIDEYVDLKEEIRGVIEAVPDMRHRTLLRHRYLVKKKDGTYCTLDEIAEKMNYSADHIRHLHRKALGDVIVPGKHKTK